MRLILFAAPAFGVLASATPVTIAPAPTSPIGQEGGGPGPLAILQSICRPGDDAERLSRRGLFVAAAAWAQSRGQAEAEPRLIDGVASADIAATASDEARPWFEQGLGLIHGFNHDEALRAFRKAQALDPDCAICLWGEAYALGPNINKPMAPEDAPRARAAAQEALAKAGAATEVERALIEAIQTRYGDGDRGALDRAYAEAMREVADRFPEHDEVQALSAEATMDAQPWDYWEPGGLQTKGMAGDALARLETVLARNPDHVASIHLHIHLTEASDDPWRAAPHAGRLASLAPGAGHLVHMPSHTWYRVGRFLDSLAANVEAVKVDEAYLAEAREAAGPIYRYGYYPHNVHFALTSAQMAGDAATALDMGGRLDAALPMEMADIEGWVQLIKASPWFARIQFGDEEELESVLAAASPEGAPAYVEAAWRYARGEAAAKLGRPDAARAEAAALAALNAQTDWSQAMAFMPAPQLLEIMQATVLGRAAMAEGDLKSAIDRFASAAEMQAALPYLEPPFWWYPARQTLGAVLLMDGQPERAEQAFLAALVQSPNNGWAWWGLAAAREARGDSAGAEAARTIWRSAWAPDAPEPALERL